MRLSFLDRDNEKTRLEKALSGKRSTFCCLYGRRRCGKSRLLQEVLPRARSVYYVADERESNLQRESVASAMSQLVPGFDEVEYRDWSSLLSRWWQDALPSSVLALDEFPYLVKSSPELPSILQGLVDRSTSKPLHLVISGSSQRMMLGLVLDASAPLYGRAQEIIHVKPLGAGWIGEALGLARPCDLLDAYCVWGGVPRYWELARDHGTTWEAVERLVLDPLGVLHNEPRRLLLDDLRETTQAASILALIGQGCHRMSEIAGRLGKPATSLTRPLRNLVELGLIRRDQPFGSSRRSGKKTLYLLDDPFLGFWFRYVEPNRSRLELGATLTVLNEIRKDFGTYRGQIWEDLVRRAVVRLAIGGLEWKPGSRWWGTGRDRKPLEIDVVAESADSGTLLVGEVKTSTTPAEAKKAEFEVRRKAEMLPFAQSFEKIITKVFVADHKGPPSKTVLSGKTILIALV
jgi:AAA+ ATPase superfamily predicted ATPase